MNFIKRNNFILLMAVVLLTAVSLFIFHRPTTAVLATPAGSLDISYVNFFPNLTFNDPVDIANAGDERLFIVEQEGIIRVTPLDSGSTAAPIFLNITDRVNDGGSEMGLLGLAFHPQYSTNGYFYVNYTYGNLSTRISRFSVTADPNVADPNSELVLLQITQPYDNHNGGDLNFGPDGYLYIGMGDGGSGGDPGDRSQNLNLLLGKMLRIDVDPAGGNPPDCGSGSNYSIPTDNPFVGQANTCEEIWAYGVRNPWRFSFDSLTGDMYIGDVGQNAWEEIDFAPASSPGGENYGWRCYEGNHPHNTSGCDPNPNEYVWPIQEYPHTGSRSVSGGYVYRGAQFPYLQGYYLYGDYISRQMWATIPDGSGGWLLQVLPNMVSSPSTFGLDVYNELYVAGYGGSGRIYQIQENTVPYPELVIDKEGPTAVPANDPITYTLTVTNTGILTATNLLISDTLPVGANYVSGGTLNGGDVTWNVSELAPDGEVTVSFVVTASQTITNEVYSVVADDGYSATGEVPVVTIILAPDLSIYKTAPASAMVGTPITYSLTISNQGTLTATNLVVSDTLPTGANYVSSDGALNGNVVTWNLGSLVAGETADFQLIVTATQTITNELYSITADGGYGAVGTEAIVTIALPPLSIHKTAPPIAESGELITYTLTITNSGGFTLTNVTISDTLPISSTFVSSPNGSFDGQVVTWDIPALPAGETVAVQFVVSATQTIYNVTYLVTADGGWQAVGAETIATLINPLHIFLPVVLKP